MWLMYTADFPYSQEAKGNLIILCNISDGFKHKNHNTPLNAPCCQIYMSRLPAWQGQRILYSSQLSPAGRNLAASMPMRLSIF